MRRQQGTAATGATPSSPLLCAWVDHIPVLWVEPAGVRGRAPLALWLPGLGGTKEEMVPYLLDLAAAGFVAFSYDPWQHGERGTESPRHVADRVFGNFRRHMWPILGQTTLDALRVVDWAMQTLAVEPPICMGGISMGGDIAVAAAGRDPRVSRVAAIISTPDWLRPGMRDAARPGLVVPPGEPDAYARFFYDLLDPLTHLASYAHRPAITFECGANDAHVPPDGALRFRAALLHIDPRSAAQVRVSLHHEVGHDVTPAMWRNCLEWLQGRAKGD